MSALIRLTLEKGVIATPENHKRTVKALGLSHRHQSRILKATPSVLGMVQNVIYLLKVENVTSLEDKPSPTAFDKNSEYSLGEVKVKQKKEKPIKVSEAKGKKSSSKKSDVTEKASATKKAATATKAATKSNPKKKSTAKVTK